MPRTSIANLCLCLFGPCSKENMLETLTQINKVYGSVEQCVITLGLLTPQGLEQLRKNMIVDAAEEDRQAKGGSSAGVVDWKEHAKLLL